MFNTIVFIVVLFVLFLIAYGITKMIMKPIKERREQKRWDAWKQQDKVGAYRG